MASQTGILKFRQSDGTYTDLYPKTTIAQVDGLQGQLDSINTSLQNKVGYNNTGKDATVRRLFLIPYESLENMRKGNVNCGYNTVSLEVATPNTNERRSIKVYSPAVRADIHSSITVFQRVNGVDTEYYIATREYVNNKITGAINASY